ncbi:LuxR C-terminal-related transcriptional regulator [Rhodococcus sp. NPDC056743]|uniref:helix-turn-helix transcriptional regulator n=1 Tax=Rhodococcus sp. NPDC056743 TaxID=3345934 RepID=UPI003672EB41
MISAWPLTGRDEELRSAAAAIRGVDTEPVNAGAAGLVITGAAGVGKTRLARDALAVACPAGARVTWTVATASAQALPLGVFADIARNPAPDPMQRVHDIVDALTVPADSGPVIVAIDDAHLLDDLSAFLVHHLVIRRLATVVLTVRSGVDVPDAITALWKDRILPRVELRPLSPDELHVLLERVLTGPVDSDSARNFWSWTRGNALYARQLVESELTAQRLHTTAGIWMWDGPGALSHSLRELIAARVGTLSADIGDVLDLVTLGEPLAVATLAGLTGTAAIEAAETQGLITVETGGSRRIGIRLAHPLFGEVRRAESHTLRLRRLRGLLADALRPSDDRSDPHGLVVRANLTLESDLPPDPELFAAAARAALELLDPALADRFAQAAWQASGRVRYQILHAKMLMILAQGRSAETTFTELAETTLPDDVRIEVATLRAANLVWMLGKPCDARTVLDDAAARASSTSHARSDTVSAIRASVESVTGRPYDAVEAARAALSSAQLPDFHAMMAIGAQVMSYGALGNITEADDAALRGYDLAAHSVETAHFKFWIGALHARALRLAGQLTECEAIAEKLRSETLNAPGLARLQTGFLIGHAHLGLGRLDSAITFLRESLAGATAQDTTDGLHTACLMWLAEALAMTGDSTAAAEAMTEFDSIHYPDFTFMDTATSIARAWTAATEGTVSQAVSLVRDAACAAHEHGQPANEVMCLQAAVQFGDHSGARRLADLANFVEGPRVCAAATHATALAADDGEGLLEASRSYESMGDAIAAADAAAQAAMAYTHAQRRGAALTASATATRLAARCRHATTPALRAASAPEPLTGRQREIVALAASGLSNRQIAQRLVVSVRTVEGHLYRASQRTGAAGRAELRDILRGR